MSYHYLKEARGNGYLIENGKDGGAAFGGGWASPL